MDLSIIVEKENVNADIEIYTLNRENKENIDTVEMITAKSLIKPIAISASTSNESLLKLFSSAEPSEGMIPIHDKSMDEIGEHIAAFCGNTV